MKSVKSEISKQFRYGFPSSDKGGWASQGHPAWSIYDAPSLGKQVWQSAYGGVTRACWRAQASIFSDHRLTYGAVSKIWEE